LLGGGDDDETQAPPGDGGQQEHDVSVSIGPASSSVLAEIGERLGGIPASLLRDSDDDGRSNSSDEPDSDAPGSDGAHSDERRSDGRSKRERYQIFGEIDRGGMGSILRGRDTDLGRELAFKVLLESHKNRPELIRRFVEEAQIGGQLQHPGVVPVYDLGTFADQRPYFTMKLVKGRTLAALLGERGRVSAPSSPRTAPDDETGLAQGERGRVSAPSPEDPTPGAYASRLARDLPRFLSIFEQVCQTLAYAHSRRVIHRDLKPANIMVGSFGEVQVMDWGLAKVLGPAGAQREPRPRTEPAASVIETTRSTSDTHATGTGSVLGTPAYMPPEQAGGEVDLVDERADVFGLGSILCEILTGQPTYTGSTDRVIRFKAMAGDTVEALGRLDRSGADPELTDLARRCVAVNLADRPRNAGEVAAAITAYLTGVQERLRKAELDRVEAQARADEEIKRRALADELVREADARAQEEAKGRALADNLAREAQARAGEERKRRRMTVGLAASVLALAGLAGGTWLVGERSRVQRHETVAQKLDDAKRLYELARAAEVDDPARWTDALAALERAEGLLAQGGDSVQQREADNLKTSLTTDHAAVQKEAEWLRRLVDIRATKVEDAGALSAENGYSVVFRDAGIDPDSLAPEAAAAKIRSAKPSLQQGLVTALDDWAALRRTERNATEAARRLLAVVRLADPDPWRDRLRAALDQPGGKERLKALQALSASAPIDDLPAVSLDLLGVSLLDEGDTDAAADLLRKAQRSRPADGWLKYNLARVLHKLGKKEEAIRYFMAARTINPETAHELAHLLQDMGESDEAIAVFRDLARLRPKNARHLTCLGNALKAQGRSQEASAAFEASLLALRDAASRTTHDPTLYFDLGYLYQSKGDLDAAIIEYKTVIRLKPDDDIAHNNLGNALRLQGKLDEAIVEYKTAIRLKPEHADAHDNLGAALGDQGKLEDEIAEYQRAIQIKPDYAIAHKDLGSAFLSQGKLDEAIAEYRKAIKLKPDLAVAHSSLGNALHDQGKLDEAVAEFRQAIKLKPDLARAHSGLGRALESQGKHQDSVVEFREAVRLDPDDLWGHGGLGLYLYKVAGDYRGAEAEFRAYIRLKPNVAAAYSNLGHVLRRQRRLDKAVTAYKKAISLDPNLAEAHDDLGTALGDQGKLDDAIAEYNAAIRLKPNFGKAHANSGKALAHQGNMNEAIAEYRTAIGLSPNDAGSRVNLGAILCDVKHDYGAAIAEFREAIRLEPDNAVAHSNLAVALEGKGKLDEAIAECRMAIRIKPDYADPHSHLGSALCDQGKLNEAIAEYITAIRIKPDFADAHSNLGNALHHQGKLDEAIAEYNTAIRLKPDHANAHNNFGNALRDQGKLDEAIAEYNTAIRLKPDHANAHTMLGVALSEQGKLAEAIAEYRTAIRLKPDLATPHNNLAWALALPAKRPRPDYDDALSHARKAVQLQPKGLEYFSTLALAEYRCGNWAESSAASERSMALRNGGDTYDWFMLALAHGRKADKDQARKWFDKAVAWTKDKKPKDKELRQFWSEAAELLGLPGPDAGGPSSPATPAGKKPR
jgi:tetratricopeptide (TPR) repeat protein